MKREQFKAGILIKDNGRLSLISKVWDDHEFTRFEQIIFNPYRVWNGLGVDCWFEVYKLVDDE